MNKETEKTLTERKEEDEMKVTGKYSSRKYAQLDMCIGFKDPHITNISHIVRHAADEIGRARTPAPAPTSALTTAAR